MDIQRCCLVHGLGARRGRHPTSDIDIGILGQSPVPNEQMLEIRAKVDAIPTLRKIEVVDLQTTDARFRAHAMKEAKQL